MTSTITQVPPVPPPSWAFSPESIKETIDNVIKTENALYDSILAIPAEQRTFANSVKPFCLIQGKAARLAEPAIFLKNVAPNDAVRNAANSASEVQEEHDLNVMSREDLYKLLVDVRDRVKAGKTGETLNSEEQRVLDRLIRDRERNGLSLPEKERKELITIKQKITKLAIEFQQNCNIEKGSLLFTEEELQGVPKDVLDGFDKVDDKYQVTFKTPDYVPLIKYADLPETRKRANLGYEGKTLQNVPILDEIIKLRKQVVKLLPGPWSNYAGYIVNVKMAKTPENIKSFLDDLQTKLIPIATKERDALLKLKRELYEKKKWELSEEESKELRLWDWRYFDRVQTENSAQLDETKVQEYFKVENVVPAILDIYTHLLGVEFVRVKADATTSENFVDDKNKPNVWHPDVELYAVWDKTEGAKEQPGKGFLGYMFLDLFPRENKYGHAAVWGLIPGWTGEDGERNYPTVCMVANLAKPTKSRPALMKHDDVVTFFHEMGHAFHGLCSKTQFAKFHGTSVARDFVEAPSQMLENWVWTKEILRRMSKHYETGEPLTEELMDAIIKSRYINQGLFNLRQIFFGVFDMTIHTSEEDLDLTKLWCDLREKVSLVSTAGEYVGGQSGFAHIVGGYEAGYYGYLYSQVFSADMFKTIFEKDPMDSKSGMSYRTSILQPGGSRDEMDSLIEFLGREPNNKAFLESLEHSDPAKL